MSYIGNTLTQQAFTPAIDYFSGNGSTTAFTLSRPVASVAQIQAVIENVPQNPSSAYTVSGNTITFTSAPPSGTNNIYVEYTSPITQVVTPGQGTVQPSSLSTGGPYWDTSGNVGIGTSSPSAPLAIGRVNSASEGGQVDLCRASDNASSWGIDVYGNTSTPSLRFIDNVASATRGEFDGSGNFSFNSGYGSAAKAYGCRAWVNFNGTGTVAIRASGNVSSITDNGTGDYTVNFTTSMPDANYSLHGTTVHQDNFAANVTAVGLRDSYTPTTTSARISVTNSNWSAGDYSDRAYVYVAIFR